ncbi:helix-turn-helix domain-containing protein [Yinghuangia sp. YIM S10712]|uniref:PucR family transcriptional regulator n=1 Tax=Yinghuangia sp. YIM S10712 TaxID=3436930 RepID=UPI003F535EE8
MAETTPPAQDAEWLQSVNGLLDAARGGDRALVRHLNNKLGASCWTLVMDQLGGVRSAEPASSAAHAPALAETCDRLWKRKGSAVTNVGDHVVLLQTLVGHDDLVFAVGVHGSLNGTRRFLINTAARLLAVAAAALRRQQQAEAALNGGVLNLLFAGDAHTASTVMRGRGGMPVEPVRFYRADPQASARQSVLDLFGRLVGSDGFVATTTDHVVAVVSAGSGADGRFREAAASLGKQRLYVGASDPAALSQCLAAYREAGHALRAGRTVQEPVTVFGALAEQRLVRLIPEPRLLEWAVTLLRPVLEHHEAVQLTETLYTWLTFHGRTSVAAVDLRVHRRTLERRLRLVGELLGADLGDECVRVRLHLALHALDRADTLPPYGPVPVHVDRDCLVWLLDIDRSLDWASAVMKPLRAADPDGRLRRTLQVWLERHGDTHGTAEVLDVHRNTVAKRLARVEELTGHTLDYVGNRAELYLALLTDHHARRGTLPREAFETARRFTDEPVLRSAEEP